MLNVSWRICATCIHAENRGDMAPIPIVEGQPPAAMEVEVEDEQAQEDGDGKKKKRLEFRVRLRKIFRRGKKIWRVSNGRRRHLVRKRRRGKDPRAGENERKAKTSEHGEMHLVERGVPKRST